MDSKDVDEKENCDISDKFIFLGNMPKIQY